MSGPFFKTSQPSKMTIDDPHAPYGKHVDIVTPFGQGADKMRIGTNGELLSHEIILKGGKNIKI